LFHLGSIYVSSGLRRRKRAQTMPHAFRAYHPNNTRFRASLAVGGPHQPLFWSTPAFQDSTMHLWALKRVFAPNYTFLSRFQPLPLAAHFEDSRRIILGSIYVSSGLQRRKRAQTTPDALFGP
jgi:hypothetical protein